jgi:hypothetical protein
MAHKLIQALRASKPAFGLWQTIPGLNHCRTLGAAAANGLSWICLDCEHGLIPLQGGASDCITAISTSTKEPPSVLVRVPATGASTGTGWQIKVLHRIQLWNASLAHISNSDSTGCRSTWRYSTDGEISSDMCLVMQLIKSSGQHSSESSRDCSGKSIPTNRQKRFW